MRYGPPGEIYIMECEGRYKIGWSTNTQRRRKGFQTGNPFKIHIVEVFYFSDATNVCEIEASIHKALKKNGSLVRGEWFNLTGQELESLRMWLAKNENRSIDGN